MRLPVMLATSALHLSGHRGRQITFRPGTSLGVGRGDNHGQIKYCETSVVTHSFVDLTHQIIIHQRWTST